MSTGLHAVGAVLAFLGVLILPGFGVRWLLRLRRREVVDPTESWAVTFCLALAVSLLIVVALAYPLLAARAFSAGRLALLLLPLAACGVLPAARWATRGPRHGWLVAGLVVLAVPFAAPILGDDHAPANNFNWYYWDLGRDLSDARGIPEWVAEYGSRVRWQPDYLSFNAVTEAYRGLFVGVSDVAALDVWKVPLSLFTLALTFAAFRLWFGRVASLLGLAFVSVSVLYTAKLGNGRPEIVGFGIGLGALVLGIDALRRRQPCQYVLAATVLAVDASVHAVGALVAGLLLAAGTAVELWGARDHKRDIARTVVLSAALVVVIVAATGWALQGRVFVVADAGNPRIVDGRDPTFTYLERSEGRFEPGEIPGTAERLGRTIVRPLPSVELDEGSGRLLLVGIVAAPVVALLLGGRQTREGTIVMIALSASLTAGAAWFALRYDTYVPQHTGLSRLMQWSPLVYGLALSAGASALVDRIGLSAKGRSLRKVTRRLGRPRLVLGLTGLVSAVALAFLIDNQFVPRVGIDEEHRQVMAELSTRAEPGEVLLANASTRGTFEFLTPVEVPLEGRQPLIEELSVLEAANAYLIDVHRYFTDPAAVDPATRFGATWVVITDRPNGVGAGQSYGGSLATFGSDSGLDATWVGEHVALFRTAGGQPAVPLGPATDLLVRLSLSCAVVGVAAVFLIRRVASPWPPPPGSGLAAHPR